MHSSLCYRQDGDKQNPTEQYEVHVVEYVGSEQKSNQFENVHEDLEAQSDEEDEGWQGPWYDWPREKSASKKHVDHTDHKGVA